MEIAMLLIGVMLLLAVVFSHFWQADGVWHAFWVTEAIVAVISYLMYHRWMGAEKEA